MSQTYYDVEALESLLEERERDLELAARIGQTLLEKNRQLVEQVSLKTAKKNTEKKSSKKKNQSVSEFVPYSDLSLTEL